jgi:hypothetical protein
LDVSEKGLPRWHITNGFFKVKGRYCDVILVVQSKTDALLLKLAWAECLEKMDTSEKSSIYRLLKFQRTAFLEQHPVQREIDYFVDVE